MMTEVQSWPYKFPASKDYPPSDERGNVKGRIQILDRYYYLTQIKTPRHVILLKLTN